MFSNVFQCFLTFSNVTYFHSHSHSLSLSHSLTLSHSFSLSHSFNLSLNHSWHAEQLLFSSLCSKVTLSLSLILSHSHTLSISHSLTLDMLNNFSFHLYAQKWLFIAENCNVFFTASSSSAAAEPYPASLQIYHRAGSQLKTYKWLGKSLRNFSPQNSTFCYNIHPCRDENKTCSACREWLNERF